MPRARSKVIKTIAHWEVVLKPAGESKFYTPDVGEMFKFGETYYERLPDPTPDSVINGCRFQEDCGLGLYRSLGEELLHAFYGPFRAVPMEAHVIKVKESKKCEPKKRFSSAQAPSAVPAPQDTPDWSVVASSANPVEPSVVDLPVMYRINWAHSVLRTDNPRYEGITATREEQETDEDQ